MKKCMLLIWLLCVLPFNTKAQNPSDVMESIIQDRIQFVSENNEDVDFSTLNEWYWQCIQQPIPLQLSAMNEISALQLLTAIQLQHLQLHLNRYGALINLYELQIIPTFDRNSIYRILPFVCIKKQHEKWSIAHPKQVFLYRIGYTNQQQIIPIKDTAYIGSPFKQYLRYRLNTNSLQLGLNAENDAGEPFFSNQNTSGFDAYAGFISFKHDGIIKQVVIGDYQANFGQGLALWTGFGFGKSSNIHQISKTENGIRPYASSVEYDFLRGTSATFAYKSFTCSPFLFSRRADANIIDTLDNQLQYSSVEGNGLHRTLQEFSKKNKTRLTGGGINAHYQYKHLHAGITWVKFQYRGITPNDGSLYEKTAPMDLGKTTRASIDLKWYTPHGLIFTEWATDAFNKKAFVIGTTQALGQRLNSSLLFRSYDAGYQTRFTLPFASGSGNNELGLFWGNEIQLNNNINITWYSDIFKSRWVKRFSPALSNGQDMLIKCAYEKRKDLQCYFLFQAKSNESSESNTTEIFKPIVIEKKQVLRGHLKKWINEHLSIQTRLVWSNFSKKEIVEHGWLVYQQINYQLNTWAFCARFTLYNTDGFNSRIYAYENDVRYAFKTPAYFNQGSSYFLLIKKKLNSAFTTWFRFGHTKTHIPVSLDQNTMPYDHNFQATFQLQCVF